ncbi:hypothetical protein SAMN02745216_02324 [Desulfatibacillum alkenivorans DSM 16219]|jgi:hypothetical protein|uniref:SGNH hydrolase-type esterase domain-containing protein n=1 Tax=Desulfatibacillum alkenivorans DSM 16219 TaxID=1121393 RepID=A0A1M6MD76_9BACT|nr:SGNH/GDSL hydrolase family protein [Desulfatibacillum alkenivorans]SHJ81422.1 hypothetical protein SAMN02745216_02324 [Desulfatibacillum alkenivorans DSM 16219]
MPHTRKITFRLLAVLLGLVLAFIILETAARLMGPEYYRFNNRSHEYYTNPRGYHHIVRMDGETPVYGLDYNFAREKYRLPPGAPKNYLDGKRFDVLGLGDSFMTGAGVKYEDVCFRRLEKMFKEEGRDLKIKNCAVPGVNLGHISSICAHELSLQPYPLVIYGFVLNDLGLPGRESITGSDFIDQNNGENQYNPWRKRLACVNLAASLIEKIRLNTQTTRAYLDAYEPDYAGPRLDILESMAKEVEGRGGRMVLVLFPLLYDFDNYRFEKCHALLRDFATNKGIPVLDLLPAFSQHKARDLWVNPTDHHPNELAHAIAAREIFRFLNQENLPPM